MRGKIGFSEVEESSLRHPEETSFLKRAFADNPGAMDHILDDLCFANSSRCKVLQDTFHDLNDPAIWKYLLEYLASRCWGDEVNRFDLLDPELKGRNEQALVEVFLLDERAQERSTKDAVLFDALKTQQHSLRYAAAYLLGLRHEPESIPVLAEMIENGNKDWKLRSVKALSMLNHESCAPPLIKALTTDKGRLHREARRALQNLGALAESVWSDALNHPDSHIRWEAAHGLGRIGDSRALFTLAEGLLDENYVVRWATANLLTQMGENGVRATLAILHRHEVDESLRQAAYYALNAIRSPGIREKIAPILDALLKSSSDEPLFRMTRRLLMEWDGLEATNNEGDLI